nr:MULTISPECIES: formyltransferase family protein [unclassified Clostridium]
MLTHKELREESLDTFAIKNNIDYSYKDTRKNTDEFLKQFRNMNLDYLISINYRYIIPKKIFTIPKYAINIHGSLLPRYRGRTPHVWSIINGEEYSGITSHFIEESVDTGNIIEQKKITIENYETGYDLLKKFEKEYPELLIQTIKKIDNNYKGTEQDEDNASYYGKRIPEMGYIDFLKDSNQIINFVRAQSYPYPGAYSYLKDGRKIIINKIKIASEKISLSLIGVIEVIDNKYFVKCIDKVLELVDFDILN